MAKISERMMKIIILQLSEEEADTIQWALGEMTETMYNHKSMADLGSELYLLMKNLADGESDDEGD